LAQIIKKEVEKKKSKLQLRYESLLKNIETEKLKINNFQEGMTQIIPLMQSELIPLQKKLNETHRKKIIRLDEVAEEIGVGKMNRSWFDSYMSEQIMELLSEDNFKDEVLKSLYSKYSGETINEDDILIQYKNLAETLKEQLGFEIDIDELRDKGVNQYFAENVETFQQQAAEYSDKEEEKFKEKKARRKRSAKQIEAEKKKVEDEKLIEQDAKSIYLRLMKKYHPDLELNEEIKAEKTEIIQRVTKAYQENDFLGLLKLQIELIEEGEKDASSLAEDMLHRYNKLLQKQLSELQMQIYQIKMSNDEVFEQFFDSKMKFSEKKFTKYRKELENQINQIEYNLSFSYNKTKGWFKDWMKEIKEQMRFSMFQNAFSGMFDDLF
jgi:hypothetical protein